MATVLVVNAGSSSLKYALVEPESGVRLAAGLVERIGEPTSKIRHEASGDHSAVTIDQPIADHQDAFIAVRARLLDVSARPPDLVGHRVVHGGVEFTAPAVIDDSVIAAIEACVPLAPLHNPAALLGIAGARAEFPAVPQVAVFDTAFHTTMPDNVITYGIDSAVAADHRIRRYGFHGTSHQYVAGRAASHLGIPIGEFNAVTLHLGNGASACAIRNGRSVETSMGVTPLEGLLMGTRSGDLDPSIPVMLMRAGLGADEIDDLLNRRSGLTGICGANDMREIHRLAEAGDDGADLARRMFVHRLRKYLGAYMVVLGRVDAIVFTAGIGEHDSWIREHTCRDVESFGIQLDVAANAEVADGVTVISPRTSPVQVLVVPTDEEHAIAAQSWTAPGAGTTVGMQQLP